MTPEQIKTLHETNDFLAVTLARLRTYQSRVTQMIATAEREHQHTGSDQERMESMLALQKIPYTLLPFEGSPRVDLAITTAAEGDDEAELFNVEFQFDAGKFIGLRTLVGEKA